VTHFASPSFWLAYEALPSSAKRVADRNFINDGKDPILLFEQSGTNRHISHHERYQQLLKET